MRWGQCLRVKNTRGLGDINKFQKPNVTLSWKTLATNSHDSFSIFANWSLDVANGWENQKKYDETTVKIAW